MPNYLAFKRTVFSVLGLLAVVVALFAIFISHSPTGHSDTIPTIAIVGSGIENPTVALGTVNDAPLPLNRSQGIAMGLGATLAFDNSSAWDALRDQFKLRTFDDRGNLQLASEAARQIANDPTIVAVIGHASSGATRAAAPIYAQAGIPLLMPIATSPEVFYPRSQSKRLKNCFRLPPADHLAQAPAAVKTITEDLKPNHVFIVYENMENRSDYSVPLKESIMAALHESDLTATSIEIDNKSNTVLGAARKIVAQRSNRKVCVVYCGYGTEGADEFLGNMRDVFSQIPNNERPDVLLTDGCLIPDLNASGFTTYLLFPSPGIEHLPSSPDIDVLRTSSAPNVHASVLRNMNYQIFGYDAMLVLSAAINNATERGSAISRHSVLASLQERGPRWKGVAFEYSFIEGENSIAKYFLHRFESFTPEGAQFRFEKTINLN